MNAERLPVRRLRKNRKVLRRVLQEEKEITENLRKPDTMWCAEAHPWYPVFDVSAVLQMTWAELLPMCNVQII